MSVSHGSRNTDTGAAGLSEGLLAAKRPRAVPCLLLVAGVGTLPQGMLMHLPWPRVLWLLSNEPWSHLAAFLSVFNMFSPHKGKMHLLASRDSLQVLS